MRVDLDGDIEIDSNWSNLAFDTHIPKVDFQEKIAFGAEKDLHLAGRDVSYLNQDYQGGRVEDLFSSRIWGEEAVIAKSHSNSSNSGNSSTEVKGRAEATMEWGGKGGTSYSLSGSVEVSNDKGQVDLTAKVDSDGQGSLTAGVEASTSGSNSTQGR